MASTPVPTILAGRPIALPIRQIFAILFSDKELCARFVFL
jgi:hypothetical protein